MRIIAGEFRGRKLDAPRGDGTRPTTDRVRESLMSALVSLRDGLDGAVVLDAFAGSGALSLEALSRGADTAVLCERDRDAAAVIERNIAALRLGRDRARLVRGDVLKRGAAAPGRPFDLVFLDPPYATDPAEVFGLLSRLDAADALAARSHRQLRARRLRRRCRGDAGRNVRLRNSLPPPLRRHHPRSFGAFVHGMTGVFHSFSIMVEWKNLA